MVEGMTALREKIARINLKNKFKDNLLHLRLSSICVSVSHLA